MNQKTVCIVFTTGVVAIAITTAALADGGPQHRAKQSAPIKMGTSGGSAVDASARYCCGGTLGSLVLYDGVRHILSNNHVLARSGSAQLGEDDIQPGLIDASCSSSTANIVGDFAGDLVPLGTANVDAALAVARGNVDTTGAILDVGIPCAPAQTASLGLAVAKSGRTTGYTTGTIQSTNTSVSVQYQQGCNQGKKFNVSYTNQLVIGAGTFSAGGDSGSLVVSNDGTPNPVGLLFAGSSSVTIANPIADVVNAFKAGGHSFSFVGSTCGGFVAEGAHQGPSAVEVKRVAAVKERHEGDLLGHPGVIGVGVGAAAEGASDVGIVVYVLAEGGSRPQGLPAAIDGVAVRVIETDAFVAR